MKIYGYDKNRDMVKVDLPERLIVDRGIDPWHLDLCDPDPIELSYGGEVVYFRRLRDVSFAYNAGAKIVVAVHDGLRTTCISSTNYERDTRSNIAYLHDAQSAGDFSLHLHRYLRNRSILQLFPQPANAVQVQGNSVLFPWRYPNFEAYPVEFVGEMFSETMVPLKLHDNINWVFQALEPFQPKIVEDSVWRIMRRQELGTVEIWVECDDLTPVAERLKDATARKRTPYIKTVGTRDQILFRFRNWSYRVTRILEPIGDLLRGGFSEGHSMLSPHGLYIDRPNQLRGSRIAFFDMSKSQARPVSDRTFERLLDPTESGHWLQSARIHGFNILEPRVIPCRAELSPANAGDAATFLQPGEGTEAENPRLPHSRSSRTSNSDGGNRALAA